MVRRILFAAALAASSLPASAADLNVVVNLGQPDYYGALDLAGFGQPRLLSTQPLIAVRPSGMLPAPLYLRVPPGHAKHWDKNCHKYQACGRPVYFVQEDWYRDVYAPRARQVRAAPEAFERGRDRNHRPDWNERDDRRAQSQARSQAKRDSRFDDADRGRGNKEARVNKDSRGNKETKAKRRNDGGPNGKGKGRDH